VGVVATNNWTNSTKELNFRLSPRLTAETMNSKSSRRLSGTSSSMESAADGTCPIASPAFLHSLRAKHAIPSGWMVTAFGPARIKTFRAVSAALPSIISQLARCDT